MLCCFRPHSFPASRISLQHDARSTGQDGGITKGLVQVSTLSPLESSNAHYFKQHSLSADEPEEVAVECCAQEEQEVPDWLLTWQEYTSCIDRAQRPVELAELLPALSTCLRKYTHVVGLLITASDSPDDFIIAQSTGANASNILPVGSSVPFTGGLAGITALHADMSYATKSFRDIGSCDQGQKRAQHFELQARAAALHLLPDNGAHMRVAYGFTHFAAVPLHSPGNRLCGALVVICGPQETDTATYASFNSPDKSLDACLAEYHLQEVAVRFEAALAQFMGNHSLHGGISAPMLHAQVARDIRYADSLTHVLHTLCKGVMEIIESVCHVELAACTALAPSHAGFASTAELANASGSASATGCRQQQPALSVSGAAILLHVSTNIAATLRAEKDDVPLPTAGATSPGRLELQDVVSSHAAAAAAASSSATSSMRAASLPGQQQHAGATAALADASPVTAPASGHVFGSMGRSSLAACLEDMTPHCDVDCSSTDVQAFRVRESLLQECLIAGVRLKFGTEVACLQGLVVPDGLARLRRSGPLPTDLLLLPAHHTGPTYSDSRVAHAGQPVSSSHAPAISSRITGMEPISPCATASGYEPVHVKTMQLRRTASATYHAAQAPGSVIVLTIPFVLGDPDNTVGTVTKASSQVLPYEDPSRPGWSASIAGPAAAAVSKQGFVLALYLTSQDQLPVKLLHAMQSTAVQLVSAVMPVLQARLGPEQQQPDPRVAPNATLQGSFASDVRKLLAAAQDACRSGASKPVSIASICPAARSASYSCLHGSNHDALMAALMKSPCVCDPFKSTLYHTDTGMAATSALTNGSLPVPGTQSGGAVAVTRTKSGSQSGAGRGILAGLPPTAVAVGSSTGGRRSASSAGARLSLGSSRLGIMHANGEIRQRPSSRELPSPWKGAGGPTTRTWGTALPQKLLSMHSLPCSPTHPVSSSVQDALQHQSTSVPRQAQLMRLQESAATPFVQPAAATVAQKHVGIMKLLPWVQQKLSQPGRTTQNDAPASDHGHCLTASMQGMQLAETLVNLAHANAAASSVAQEAGCALTSIPLPQPDRHPLLLPVGPPNPLAPVGLVRVLSSKRPTSSGIVPMAAGNGISSSGMSSHGMIFRLGSVDPHPMVHGDNSIVVLERDEDRLLDSLLGGRALTSALLPATSAQNAVEQQQFVRGSESLTVNVAELDGVSALQARVELLVRTLTSALHDNERISRLPSPYPLDQTGQVHTSRQVSSAGMSASPATSPRLASERGFGASQLLSLSAAAELAALELHEVIGRGFAGAVMRGSQWGMECAIKVFDYPHGVPEYGEDDDGLECLTGSAWGTAGVRLQLSAQGCHSPDTAAAEQPQLSRALERVKLAAQRKKVRLMVERVAAELAVSQALHHPNIIQVYTHFTRVRLRCKSRGIVGTAVNGVDRFELIPALPTHIPDATEHSDVCLALVMEYCDRGSLMDIMTKGTGLGRHLPNGTFQPNMISVLRCLIELALALRHMHEQHIVHCDVKPGNLMARSCARDPRGFTCKLADFGFAKLLTPGQGPGGRAGIIPSDSCGTLPFMSPELFVKGHVIDWSVDIYAFGVTMQSLYTGRAPYNGMRLDAKSLMRAVVVNTLRPHLPAECPEAFRQLAARCWSKDPITRPSATEIATLLDQQLKAHMAAAVHCSAAAPAGSAVGAAAGGGVVVGPTWAASTAAVCTAGHSAGVLAPSARLSSEPVLPIANYSQTRTMV